MLIKVEITGFDTKTNVARELRMLAYRIEQMSDEEIESGGNLEEVALNCKYEESNMEGE